jgi:hypothetical protein
MYFITGGHEDIHSFSRFWVHIFKELLDFKNISLYFPPKVGINNLFFHRKSLIYANHIRENQITQLTQTTRFSSNPFLSRNQLWRKFYLFIFNNLANY